MFSRWVDLVRIGKHVTKCRRTIDFFETVQNLLHDSHFQELLQSPYAIAVKEKAIRSMVSNYRQRL